MHFIHRWGCGGLLTAFLAGVAPAENSPLEPAPASTPPMERLSVRLSWGHRGAGASAVLVRLRTAGSAQVNALPEGFEPEDRWDGATARTSAGGGDVDAVVAEVRWRPPTAPVRKPHSIWAFLLQHGEPGQIARLLEDPGLTPDAPVLTVEMAEDGTRGFSVSLESLRQRGAMWLPEHDFFVTRADAPEDFAAHLASLSGERVLDRVKREPEATLDLWRSRWVDFGDPTRPHHGQETRWLGTEGHLTGAIARHGSLYKFGIDRWANVRPDFASPHRFRFDVLWPGARWRGQRILEGLPVIVTELERDEVRGVVEQFAAPVPGLAPAARGEVPSVLYTRVEWRGSGPVSLGFGLSTEATNRHPEVREVAGRLCVVDRETGNVWLMVEPGAGLAVQARPAPTGEPRPRLEFEVTGRLEPGELGALVLKLASPTVAAADAAELAGMEYRTSRAEVVRYWEDWLARGARFVVPEPAVNDLFRANLWHALFLPRHRTDDAGVARMDLPYSNFAYGQFNADWPINQAVYVDYMIYGLRGYFDVAEEEFAAMYQTQQKADGRVGGYAEWGVYTPGMLYSIGQNFLRSGDRASFARLLPASLKALDWCLREVERGRESAAAPGLVVAPLNDLTHEARAWGFPNAYFVAGLETFGRALTAWGHPRGDAVLSVARRMRGEVEQAFARASVQAPAARLADGTWINYVPCDALTPRRLLDAWYPTDVDCGPLHLARLAAIDPRGWLATAMLHDHEDNLFLDQWGMANEPVYNPQATAYLLRDEPEAAIRAFYSMMACAFSHGQLTPLEHRWAWGQYYMPPSTDGAWFELYRNLLLSELCGDGTLFVGRATPRAWLADGQRILVENAPTYFGPVNLQMRSAAASGRLEARVEFASTRRPMNLVVRFRHPGKKPISSVTVNGVAWSDFDSAGEWVRIPFPREGAYSIVTQYED